MVVSSGRAIICCPTISLYFIHRSVHVSLYMKQQFERENKDKCNTRIKIGITFYPGSSPAVGCLPSIPYVSWCQLRSAMACFLPPDNLLGTTANDQTHTVGKLCLLCWISNQR